MRGTDITELIAMVKAELLLDSDSEVSPAGDAALAQQISTMQKWLALRHDWEFLRTEKTVNLVAGTRYYAFPTSGSPATLAFELGRPVEVHCYFGELWNPVEYGISPEQYNYLNPTLDQRCDPVNNWQFYDDAGTLKLEVWPLPATAMTFRIVGQRRLNRLTTAGDLCDLDDVLIVQFTAAKLAARMKSADAAALLAQAQETLKQLRAGYPQAPYGFNTAASTNQPPRDWDRPTVATMITP